MSYINNLLNLILKFEDFANAYEFLENLVYHKGDKVYVRFNVKNFDAIRKTGSQKIRKGPRLSATSLMIKINMMMATFFRIRREFF